EAGPCKPETTFGWSSHGSKGFTKSVTPRMIVDHDFGHKGRVTWMLADVNADGLEDLIISHPSVADSSIDEWWVGLNKGGTFDAPMRWASFAWPNNVGNWSAGPGDYDQDGLTDIFLDGQD